MKRLASILIAILALAPALASAATITHSLSVGSRGAEVTVLQEVLIKLGFLKVGATGYFGVLTRQAVMAFQKSNGLEQVGSVGPKTRSLLNGMLSTEGQASVITPPCCKGTPTSSSPVPTDVNQAATSAPPSTPEPPASVPVQSTAPSPDSPPIVTLVSPTSLVSKSATEVVFSVATDKPSLCRFGTQSGMSLSYMTAFEDTLGTAHAKTLTGLSTGGLYVYYVRCEDASARISNELQVNISLTGQ